MSRKLDLVGHVYERLTVMSNAGYEKGFSLWLCQCECGNKKVVRGNGLRTGNTSSCGCLMMERAAVLNRSHGKSGTRAHRIWKAMLTRVTNVNQPSAGRYVLRGITVCDRWRHSFENFLADMGECPEGLTLDRIDNDGNYTPENCRWATQSTQARNCGGKNGRNRGVSWMKIQKKWRVVISSGGKSLHIGVFADKNDAIKARKAAEKIYWPDLADN